MKKKMQADNRGLTLIELIVAISISMIVLGSIWQFIITSTKTYSSQKDNVDLQVEVQQTMNHLQNLFVDANRSVAYLVGGQEVGNDSLHENAAAATTKAVNIYSDNKVGKIEWDKNTQKLTYQELKVTNGTVESPAAPAAEGEEAAAVETEVLAEGVIAFEADVSKVVTDRVVKLNLTFQKGSATYQATRDITLRNQLLASNTPNDIYANDTLPEGVVSVALQIVPDQEITLSQRASYDFSATINGAVAGEMKVMWTIGNNTSGDTSIDIESGVLSIGANETPGNRITVTATLASDRRVKASTTVEVIEAVPSITIVKSPKYVLRGESYASSFGEGRPIQVKIENAEEEYTLSISENAMKAGIRVDGKTIVIPNQFSEEVGPWFQFEVTATTVATPEQSASVYMIVRDPEFDIVASDSGISTGEYMRGQTVTLSPDWSDSAVVMKETIAGAEVVYEEAVYNVTDLNKTEIAWSYEYVTQTGETKTVAIESGNSFVVPLDIKTSGATIKVHGYSKQYGTEINDEIVLNVADVAVGLSAVFNGTTYTAGQKITNVNIAQQITLYGTVALYTDPRMTWLVYEGEPSNSGLGTVPTQSSLLKVETVSTANHSARLVVGGISNKESLYGKTFTIRATDTVSGLYKEISFEVNKKINCTTTTANTFHYLYNAVSGNQKSFAFNVAEGTDLQEGDSGYWTNELSGPLNVDYNTANDTVVFTPQQNVADAYTFHMDSQYTGQHMLSATFVGEATNIELTKDGKTIEVKVPYYDESQMSTVWSNRNNIHNKIETSKNYINFYGTSSSTNNPVTYTYKYTCTDEVYVVYNVRVITLTVTVDGIDFTRTYKQEGSVGFWGDWKETS